MRECLCGDTFESTNQENEDDGDHEVDQWLNKIEEIAPPPIFDWFREVETKNDEFEQGDMKWPVLEHHPFGGVPVIGRWSINLTVFMGTATKFGRFWERKYPADRASSPNGEAGDSEPPEDLDNPISLRLYRQTVRPDEWGINVTKIEVGPMGVEIHWEESNG